MLRNTFHVSFLFAVALAAVILLPTDAQARPGGGRSGRAGGVGSRSGGGLPSPTGDSGTTRPAGFRAQGPRPAALGDAGVRPSATATSAGTQQVQSFLNLPQSGQSVRNQISTQQFSDQPGQLRSQTQEWLGNATSGPQPFSPAWYAQHPNAWQYAHPHADAWAAATVAATANWLGWTTIGGSTSTSVTYVEAAPAEPTPAEPLVDSGLAPTSAAPVPAGEWLSLGVFALDRPGGGGRQVVQLAVARSARVQGVYYDDLLGVTANVSGTVDRATQQVTWSPEGNPRTVFAADLAGLAAAETRVKVTTDGGVQQWTAVRLESPQP
ncbi:MAG: hypothetical protein CMJ58_05430 [Planctomycetaceae bacterium]|nr:hypothetical protein [Planctomycetaceae bacterium]